MNKTLFKICFVIAATMSYSSMANAVVISGTTSLGGGTFSPSSGVEISVASVPTSYAAVSGHKVGGDRSVGTNNSQPKMFWTLKTKGSSCSDPANSTESFNNWTSL